jgi:flagellar basal body-associated protein FliL
VSQPAAREERMSILWIVLIVLLVLLLLGGFGYSRR